MLGGQQIPAYKTIMKTPRHLPRHTKSAVSLFRVIAWGAVAVLIAMTSAIVAAKIASYGFSIDPVFLVVIPIVLALLFCWWWIDVAPIISRWLIVFVAFVAGAFCLLLAWNLPFWAQVQIAAVIIYLVAVSKLAWQQIRASTGEENDRKPSNTTDDP